jgi:hypothetical protein
MRRLMTICLTSAVLCAVVPAVRAQQAPDVPGAEPTAAPDAGLQAPQSPQVQDTPTAALPPASPASASAATQPAAEDRSLRLALVTARIRALTAAIEFNAIRLVLANLENDQAIVDALSQTLSLFTRDQQRAATEESPAQPPSPASVTPSPGVALPPAAAVATPAPAAPSGIQGTPMPAVTPRYAFTPGPVATPVPQTTPGTAGTP